MDLADPSRIIAMTLPSRTIRTTKAERRTISLPCCVPVCRPSTGTPTCTSPSSRAQPHVRARSDGAQPCEGKPTTLKRRTQNPAPRTQNPEPRTSNVEPRTETELLSVRVRPGTCGAVYAKQEFARSSHCVRRVAAERTVRSRCRTPATLNDERRTPNLEPRTQNLEPRTERSSSLSGSRSGTPVAPSPEAGRGIRCSLRFLGPCIGMIGKSARQTRKHDGDFDDGDEERRTWTEPGMNGERRTPNGERRT
jgi:hypothetical protein